MLENRLVIIGGAGFNDSLSSVELIHEGKNLSCNIASFPYALHAHSATIIPTGILVCGGWSWSFEGQTNTCYEYKKNTSSWHSFPSMTTKRAWFDMKFLNQGIWAIGGSITTGSDNSLDNFDFHTKVWTKHSIPINITSTCLAKLTPFKLIVIGGIQNSYARRGFVSKT